MREDLRQDGVQLSTETNTILYKVYILCSQQSSLLHLR